MLNISPTGTSVGRSNQISSRSLETRTGKSEEKLYRRYVGMGGGREGGERGGEEEREVRREKEEREGRRRKDSADGMWVSMVMRSDETWCRQSGTIIGTGVSFMRCILSNIFSLPPLPALPSFLSPPSPDSGYNFCRQVHPTLSG